MYDKSLLVNVTNYRIESLIHQIYTVSQEKRSLYLYDDKRYLVVNLSIKKPNSNTRAFSKFELEQNAAQLAINQPNSKNNLFIQQYNSQNVI